MTTENNYPATLTIDYPDQADRMTTLFRIFTIIPIIIIIGLISGSNHEAASDQTRWHWVYGGGILFLPTLLMIVFREKYPRWWYDWNLALTKFAIRVLSYVLLLTHEYPSTDEEQSTHIEIPYPDVQKDLDRWLPLVKWFLAIPHYIILAFLIAAVMICTIIGWFAILVTGKYPRGMFDFVVGVLRWSLRVEAYAILLTTDEYPPFRLD